MDYNKIIKESLNISEGLKVVTDPTILGKTVSQLDNTEYEISDAYGITERIIVAADEFTTDSDDRFKCERDAEKYLEEKGYSVGHMQAGSPMAIMKGKFDIAKWRNLDRNDKKGIDGILFSYNKNKCIVLYFNTPE